MASTVEVLTMYERTCLNCGKGFKAKHRNGKYCSERCGYEWRRGNNPPCSVQGCGHSAQREGMCPAHFARKRDGRPVDAPLKRRRSWGVVCSVDGCGRSGGHGHGLCGAHYYRLKRHGDVLAHIPVKTQRPNGEGWIDSNGYRCINGVKEHRLVMQASLGRNLYSDEHVHHINGDRLDNRPENLELWVVRRQPPGQRVSDRVADAIETLERYAPDLLTKGCVQLRAA
jgi:ribosomal protein S27AE